MVQMDAHGYSAAYSAGAASRSVAALVRIIEGVHMQVAILRDMI